MKNILILNGPNLNLIGVREPEIYGSVSILSYVDKLVGKYPDISLDYFQSNHEGHLIDKIHDVGFLWEGIILNAGAYSHTSIAIADAIKAITCPVVEVHISNIYERESFRHHSYLKEVCQHHVIGKGLEGYEEALIWLIDQV